MIVGRLYGSRFKTYLAIGAFSTVVLLSILSIFTNVVLSVFLTAGTITHGSMFASLVEDGTAYSIEKRDVSGSDVRVGLDGAAVGGVQGIEPGYNVVDTWSVDSNQTSDRRNETEVVFTVGNITGTNLTMAVPDIATIDNETLTTAVFTGPKIVPYVDENGVAPGIHPWWWVDFEVQNETHLKEVDVYLKSIAEYHNFSVHVTLDEIDSLNVVSYVGLIHDYSVIV